MKSKRPNLQDTPKSIKDKEAISPIVKRYKKVISIVAANCGKCDIKSNYI